MKIAFLGALLLIGSMSLIGCNPLNMAGPNDVADKGAAQRAAEKAAEQARLDKENQARIDKENAEREERQRIKTSIESVLAQDAKTNAGAQSVAEVVDRMRLIDTSACPADFRSAYLDHLYAWKSLADVESNAIAFKKEANSDAVAVEAFIRGYLGDPLGKVNELDAAQTQLQRDYKDARASISQTFHRVEDVAITYGADLPK
jgi:hypothetical protein